FTPTAPPSPSPLSLHDALPILKPACPLKGAPSYSVEATRLRRDLFVGKGRDARALRRVLDGDRADAPRGVEVEQRVLVQVARLRSEERRVGKECRSGLSQGQER